MTDNFPLTVFIGDILLNHQKTKPNLNPSCFKPNLTQFDLNEELQPVKV